MLGEYKDFIGHYRGVVSRHVCNTLIASIEGERMRPLGLMDRTSQYANRKHIMDDRSAEMFDLNIDYHSSDLGAALEGAKQDVPEIIDKCVEEYVGEYPVSLETIRGQSFNQIFKIQATLPGQGYNIWHSEWCIDNPNRFLVWILYLNDIEDGGETEFLYYPKRVQPRAGDLIVWPAGFTHSHRGNPPLKDKKYIMTGWITQH